jgi:hypothetical protein
MAPTSVLLPGWNLPDKSLQLGLLRGIPITTVAAILTVDCGHGLVLKSSRELVGMII